MFKAFYGFTLSRKRFATVIFFADRLFPHVFVTIYLVFCGFIAYNRIFTSLVLYASVPFAALALGFIIRSIVKRPRPCTQFKITGPYANKPSPSFPSNHVTAATAIAYGCLYISIPVGIVVFCLAILTALCRLFTGAHYPSDVCAGFLLATFTALVGFSGIASVL